MNKKQVSTTTGVLALPVSVEQIAVAIKQMSQTDQQRLLDLVPHLRQIATQSPARTVKEAQTAVAHLQAEVLQLLSNQVLSPDESFKGGLTLAQYLALSEEEKDELWDQWAETDLMALEEQEVDSDALPAG
jgi:hypothetical protein